MRTPWSSRVALTCPFRWREKGALFLSGNGMGVGERCSGLRLLRAQPVHEHRNVGLSELA